MDLDSYSLVAIPLCVLTIFFQRYFDQMNKVLIFMSKTIIIFKILISMIIIYIKEKKYLLLKNIPKIVFFLIKMTYL